MRLGRATVARYELASADGGSGRAGVPLGVDRAPGATAVADTVGATGWVGRARRVACAFAAAALRFRVVAALRPAARRLRVVAAFAAAVRRLRVVAALRPAALRFRVTAAFLAADFAMARQSIVSGAPFSNSDCARDSQRRLIPTVASLPTIRFL